MQGYVTELILTLESVVETLDSDFRPMDIIKEIFKSTPNLKEVTYKCNKCNKYTNTQIQQLQIQVGGFRRGAPGYAGTPSPLQHNYHVSAPPIGPYHNRASSYNMSPHHCNTRRQQSAASPVPGEPRGRRWIHKHDLLTSQIRFAAGLPSRTPRSSLRPTWPAAGPRRA
jgi:hypothetical protein